MPILVLFCVAGLIYAAAIAFRQTDLKYIIGFSSVSHLGLVLIGLAAMNQYGLNGAGIELFAGGVMTGPDVLAGRHDLRALAHARNQ